MTCHVSGMKVIWEHKISTASVCPGSVEGLFLPEPSFYCPRRSLHLSRVPHASIQPGSSNNLGYAHLERGAPRLLRYRKPTKNDGNGTHFLLSSFAVCVYLLPRSPITALLAGFFVRDVHWSNYFFAPIFFPSLRLSKSDASDGVLWIFFTFFGFVSVGVNKRS